MLFFRGSVILVAKDTVACDSISEYYAGLIRIAGLVILVDWNTLLELPLLTVWTELA